MELTVTNPNQALCEALQSLRLNHVEETSRNGPVWVFPEPVLTTYTLPQQRVLFSPLRDANPFFHLIGDALWCLAGRSDVSWPVYFNKKYIAYSDDGKEQWGAYGRRWRTWWGYDQLSLVIQELKANPNSRRAVLAMWDACEDRGMGNYDSDLQVARCGGVDVPCNTHCYFDLRNDELNLTVCCRSNDLWWGAYGANCVVFSVLQEYVAAALGAELGVYRQFSNNLHLYPEIVGVGRIQELAQNADEHNYYLNDGVGTFSLINTDIQTWDADLQAFFNGATKFKDVFFSGVVFPMFSAWQERKERRGTGLGWARLISAPDWRKACVEWIVRHEQRKATVATPPNTGIYI